MRIWLHESKGNESGWNAWSLDYLGFATWAPSREGVLHRIQGKFEEYIQWLEGHLGEKVTIDTWSGLEVAEEISGDEVAFKADLDPADSEEIKHCLRLLGFSRSDLLSAVEDLPDAVLDWNPPYANFAAWASWRTIRQVLKHIAATETGYYLSNIGYQDAAKLPLADLHWREQLAVSRMETERLLGDLLASQDRARAVMGEEAWSVRKVLRRLVRHELLHRKSIQRIAHAYADFG